MAEHGSEDEEFSLECRTFEKTQSDMVTEGFRTGLNAGRESSLQEGFNVGYKHTLTASSKLAHLRGKLTAVLCRAHSSRGHVTESEDLIGQLEELVEEVARLEKRVENGESLSEVSECVGDNREVPLKIGGQVDLQMEGTGFVEIQQRVKDLMIKCGLSGET